MNSGSFPQSFNFWVILGKQHFLTLLLPHLLKKKKKPTKNLYCRIKGIGLNTYESLSTDPGTQFNKWDLYDYNYYFPKASSIFWFSLPMS